MKNKDLIEKLQEFSPETEVAVIDINRLQLESDGNGTTFGVYPDFGIQKEDSFEDSDGNVFSELIWLTFDNFFIEEDDILAEESGKIVKARSFPPYNTNSWLQGYVLAVVTILREEGINTTLSDMLFNSGIGSVQKAIAAGCPEQDIEELKKYYE